MVSVDPRSATSSFFTMMLASSIERNLGGGAWQVGWGLLLVEYLPFYGLLVVEWWRRRRSVA